MSKGIIKTLEELKEGDLFLLEIKAFSLLIRHDPYERIDVDKGNKIVMSFIFQREKSPLKSDMLVSLIEYALEDIPYYAFPQIEAFINLIFDSEYLTIIYFHSTYITITICHKGDTQDIPFALTVKLKDIEISVDPLGIDFFKMSQKL